MRTLLDLKIEARRRRRAGKTIEALKVYRLVLEGAPLDFDLRFEIADLFLEMGRPELAASVYGAVFRHDFLAGNPLRALVAVKQLHKMGFEPRESYGTIARKYCLGSKELGKSVALAPADLGAEIRKGIDLDYPMEEREVVEGLAKMAAYTDNIRNYPALVPPIAIFSSFEREVIERLLPVLSLRRFDDGEEIIHQGVVGDAIYFVARGDVRLVRRDPDGSGVVRERQITRLGPGSAFGEMALVSEAPRVVSAVCDGPVDAFELKREAVERESAASPAVAAAMARFIRERLVLHVLATNPMFKPFDENGRKQLLSRFTGHDVPAGTIFIEEGHEGKGLYVLVRGKAEVLKWDGEKHVLVANLGPNNIAGEISLIQNRPATATVRTTTPATLLFLSRELFFALVESVPELRELFTRLSEVRLEDTEAKMHEARRGEPSRAQEPPPRVPTVRIDATGDAPLI